MTESAVAGRSVSSDVARAAAVSAALFLFLPRFFYQPVQSGLDGSWVIALHAAFEQGLVFGRDLLFTFGPLGILATRLPIGDGIRELLAAYDLFFYLNVLSVLLFAVSGARIAVRAALLLAVALLHAPSLYFLDPPVLLVLFSFFWFCRAQDSRRELHYVFSLANGLLALLMKAHFGIVAVALIGSWNIIAFVCDRNLRHLVRLGVSIAAVFGVCALVHVDLPRYLFASLHFAAGYPDAMSADVKEFRTLVGSSAAGLSAGGIACAIWFVIGRRDPRSVFRVLWLGAILVLLWKQAVVRADAHVWVFLETAPLAVATAALFAPPRARAALFAALSALAVLLVQAEPGRYRGEIFSAKLSNAVRAVNQLFYQPLNAERSEIPIESKISAELREIIASETVDIIPHELSSIWYYGLNYRPRGVMQSYAAYNSWLDGASADGLRRESAPRFFLFQPGCIDRRYCFFDEPLTRRAILERYLVRVSTDRELLLERSANIRQIAEHPLQNGRAVLGERIVIPETSELLVFRTSLGYSNRGAIRRAVLRPSELQLVLERADGRKQKFRAVLPLLNAGVPVNKWVETLEEYQLFFSGANSALESVRSIELDSKLRQDFDEGFEYEFSALRTR